MHGSTADDSPMWVEENRMGDDGAAVRLEENTFRRLIATAADKCEPKHAAPPGVGTTCPIRPISWRY